MGFDVKLARKALKIT